MTTVHTTLAVNGMTCESCVRHVTAALAALPTVVDVAVNLADGRATLKRDPGAVTLEALVAALVEEGYEARDGVGG